MPIYWHNDKILWRGGRIAWAQACCCGDESDDPETPCVELDIVIKQFDLISATIAGGVGGPGDGVDWGDVDATCAGSNPDPPIPGSLVLFDQCTSPTGNAVFGSVNSVFGYTNGTWEIWDSSGCAPSDPPWCQSFSWGWTYCPVQGSCSPAVTRLDVGMEFVGSDLHWRVFFLRQLANSTGSGCTTNRRSTGFYYSDPIPLSGGSYDPRGTWPLTLTSIGNVNWTGDMPGGNVTLTLVVA